MLAHARPDHRSPKEEGEERRKRRERRRKWRPLFSLKRRLLLLLSPSLPHGTAQNLTSVRISSIVKRTILATYGWL
jgi:hypothetical protein